MSGDLAELQSWMAKLLVVSRSLDKSEEIVEQAAERVTGNDRLLPVDQLEIYREQFWLRHTASLIEDFPGLSGILGQRDWERLIEEYLVALPPRSHSLRDLGDRLPGFVERSEWLPHRELCTDMARLEWAFIEAFDAPDAGALDAQRLAAIPPDAWQTARIVLDPALRLLRVRYPVGALRSELRTKKQHVPIPEPEAQNLVVYRAERNLFWQDLEARPFEVLVALGDGLPLVAAVERAIELTPPDSPTLEDSVSGWFQDWGRRGFIVDVVTT